MRRLPTPRSIRIINEVLGDNLFSTGIDVGCGEGRFGKEFKKNVRYLIGIDYNPISLRRALNSGFYDEVLEADIHDMTFPSANIAFLIEIIEHLSKDDGFRLLRNLRHIPVIVITTPSKYWNFIPKEIDGHKCVWSLQDFYSANFFPCIFRRDALTQFMFGEGIIALKGSQHLKNKLNLKTMSNNKIPLLTNLYESTMTIFNSISQYISYRI